MPGFEVLCEVSAAVKNRTHPGRSASAITEEPNALWVALEVGVPIWPSIVKDVLSF
jgi:hypothetical protein